MPNPSHPGASMTSTTQESEPQAVVTGSVNRRPRPQVAVPAAVEEPGAADPRVSDIAPLMELHNVSVFYGDFEAVRETTMPIQRNRITAMIGPSGCGKSTIVRTLNRMNDLIPGARVTGKVTYHGQDIYAPGVDPIQVRRHIGMVFQKPNPFPKSIYDNVAYGLRINGSKGRLDDQVEQALSDAALWDEVKDKLKTSAFALSGGQQQRLCIARAIAVRPDVILMDEPCSALDPISTGRIEDLMRELARTYTIVIVTHNMQQAARISHSTAFFTAEIDERQIRYGRLVEFDHTDRIFTNPADGRTEAYVTGRFG
jgi:phosphate transport system ATP-binding protein